MSISTIDADGIALETRTRDQAAEIAALRAEVAELRRLLTEQLASRPHPAQP